MVVYLCTQEDDPVHDQSREHVYFPKIRRSFLNHRTGHVFDMLGILVKGQAVNTSMVYGKLSEFFFINHVRFFECYKNKKSPYTWTFISLKFVGLSSITARVMFSTCWVYWSKARPLTPLWCTANFLNSSLLIMFGFLSDTKIKKALIKGLFYND